MKIDYFLFVAFLTFHTCTNGLKIADLSPRKERRPMKTSVIVPCVARHFLWLSGMLENYQNQTVRPDEVVVSLSEVEKLNPKEINDIEQGDYSFDLKIIRNTGRVIDGDNRTIAMNNSSGEILIFSDADDIPHPQRVEISKFIFENYEVDHILHGMAFARSELSLFSLDSTEVLKFKSFQQIWDFAMETKFAFTTGSPCFLRKIGNAIKWTAIRDREHAVEVYQRFENCIVLKEKLILYRLSLSSHGNRRSLVA